MHCFELKRKLNGEAATRIFDTRFYKLCDTFCYKFCIEMIPIVDSRLWHLHVMPMVRVSYLDDEITVLGNLDAVGDALNRPAFHLLYFISKYLATGFEYDARQADVQYKLLRRVEEGQVQRVIDKFIRVFVSCRKCAHPRTIVTYVDGTRYFCKRCNFCDTHEHIAIECACDCDY